MTSKLWKDAFFQQIPSDFKKVDVVYTEHVNCRAANWSFSYYFCSAPSEMGGPIIRSGMEETGHGTGIRIDARDIRPLMHIAVETGKGKIGKRRFAAMLARNDVIDLEGRWITGRGKTTILTSIACPSPDLFDGFRSH